MPRVMSQQRAGRLLAIFAGGSLGTLARAGLLELFADSMLSLAAINVGGALLLGALSGRYGLKVTATRLFLATGGVASFTSWSTLALQGISSPLHAMAVAGEFAFGIGAAGLGHVLARRWWRR